MEVVLMLLLHVYQVVCVCVLAYITYGDVFGVCTGSVSAFAGLYGGNVSYGHVFEFGLQWEIIS